MNIITLALILLSYVRARLAALVGFALDAEPVQHSHLAPRRLRPSRRQLKRRAAGAGARRIDAGAGIVAQARP